MRLVSFQRGTAASYGILLADGRVLDLPAAARRAGASLPDTLLGLIAAGPEALALARRLEGAAGEALPAGEVALLAPIPRPAKNVFCVGRNYKDHVAEGYRAAGTATKLPEYPQFFTKPPTAVIGPDEAFFHDPAVTAKLDLSAGLTLEPGDIIATDTPSGVGYAMDPPQHLTAGDVVECSIDSIGTLRTPIEEYRA